MRDQNRESMTRLARRLRSINIVRRYSLFFAALLLCACNSNPPKKSSPAISNPAFVVSDHSRIRAERRAYDGAPPVIPHMRLGANCTSCHSQTGIQFGEMGFAPPMPHTTTKADAGMFARCEQCHVYAEEKAFFVENEFSPLRQDLRKGKRATSLSPPVMPHPVFMRENCAACHTGPAAREEIRCPHPERVRCAQCHVPVMDKTEFVRVSQSF